jgi:polysaccharide biosynthesis/export protein
MRYGHISQRYVRLVAAVVTMAVWSVVPVSGQPSPAGYLLGSGDTLEVSVWGYADLTRQVIVGPDGAIGLPLVGSIPAEGRSLNQLQAAITKAYAEYIINPKITVAIKEYRKIRVSLLGQVTRPGTYELSAGARILDFIAAAGGLTDAAATKTVQLMRPGAPSVVVDVSRALAGDASANLPLRGGEALVVPEDLANLVIVQGEVAHPGRYRIKDGMRVLDALLIAGGLTERASLDQARLVRASGKGQDLLLDSMLLHQDFTANVALEPGDTLLIPEDTNNRFYVIGDVHAPGMFRLKGETTLLQAIAMAGGPEQRGMGTAKTAYIVRGGGPADRGVIAGPATTSQLPNGRTLITADLRALMQGGDTKNNVPVRPGDVVVIPQTGLRGFEIILNIFAGLASLFH